MLGGTVEDLPIGRRVAYWRQRRKMSQQVFADRLGKSKSWVDKVERGVRRLDKFSVLYDIAEILQVDVQVLIGRDSQRLAGSVNCIDQVEVEEIRAALERYDRIGTLFDPKPVEPVPLGDLRKAVRHAWMSFQYAKYGVLARTLPRLLRDAQTACGNYTGDQSLHSASLLAQVYQIAASALRKLGEHDLGWLAADRAVAMAQRTGDPLMGGIATFRVANALLALGRPRAALELNVSVAHKLWPAYQPTPEVLSVYGILLLQAAMAAARAGDNATVRDLLREAGQTGKQLGGDCNHYWTSFGPTNVAVHQAAAAVELGEGRLAVAAHDALTPDDLSRLTPERRANHYLDVARACVQDSVIDRATELLLEADRLAPSEIRCRPIAHETVTDVMRRSRGAPPSALTELADNMGIAV